MKKHIAAGGHISNTKQETHTKENNSNNNSNNNDKRTNQAEETDYKKGTYKIIIIIIIIINRWMCFPVYTMYPDFTFQTPSNSNNNKLLLLLFDGPWKVKAKYIVLSLNALAKFWNAKEARATQF